MKLFKKLINLLFPVIFTLFIVISCDDSITNEDIDNTRPPTSNLSFGKDIFPIFQVKCVRCHNATDPDGGLDLTSYGAATANLNVIFPGEPELSSLVWAIEARSGVEAMPPIGYPTLKSFHIDAIKTWIDEGAKNN